MCILHIFGRKTQYFLCIKHKNMRHFCPTAMNKLLTKYKSMLIARGNLCIKWVTDAHFAMQKRNFGLSDKSSFVVIKKTKEPFWKYPKWLLKAIAYRVAFAR